MNRDHMWQEGKDLIDEACRRIDAESAQPQASEPPTQEWPHTDRTLRAFRGDPSVNLSPEVTTWAQAEQFACFLEADLAETKAQREELLGIANGISQIIRDGKPSSHLWNYCVEHLWTVPSAAIARAERKVE